jgi:Zn-dependent metalloprotease
MTVMTRSTNNIARPACRGPASQHGILPPYLLSRLAQSPDADVAARARETLRVERTLRVRRELRGSRSPRGRVEAPPAPGGAGIIPDALLHRTDPAPQVKDGPRVAPDLAGTTASPRRRVYDAEHRTKLPGVLRRAEGSPPAPQESVNEAYDGLGLTWRFLFECYGRDSLDGLGLPLPASVHFGRDYANAFWDGEQMVFGDGDGRIFRSFTDCLDVIAHELAHGFTQYTRAFVYVGESGALNEHLSDVLGVLTAQFAAGQSADEASWLIGAGLFTPAVHGVALRSLKAPGTAYEDPVLGRDPQPSHWRDYVRMPHDEEHDNGGVHINSGIPNHAFYLAARQIGGRAWETIGQVWYDVMTRSTLPKDTDFVGFAAATLGAARDRYGERSAVHEAIVQAWQSVGIAPAPRMHPAYPRPAEPPGWPHSPGGAG